MFEGMRHGRITMANRRQSFLIIVHHAITCLTVTSEADGNAAAKAVCIPLSLALERGQKTFCFLLFFAEKNEKV